MDIDHRRGPVRSWAAAPLLLALLLLLAGCATQGQVQLPPRAPQEVRAQLIELLPAHTRDREGWASDIQSALQLLDIPASTENLCAVLAVTEQESTFNADPPVANLPRIARGELARRAAERGVPAMLVSTALRLRSGSGLSYAERLDAVRTERELSELYEDFVDKVPLGRRLLGGANPVRTGGPMQVRIAFAERHVRRQAYPHAIHGSIRHEVFTRRGGLYFGIAHLLDYRNSYDRHLYRYADFNAGWYASRNAAFQAAVSKATGVPLALDGDLVLHGAGRDRVGETESAVRSLGPRIGLGDAAIRTALEQGTRFSFEESNLYARVFELAERVHGSGLPRAVVPRITLDSPKITRTLTTAWFADRVETRYRRCINKAYR